MKNKTPRKEKAPLKAGRKEKSRRSHYADLSASAQRHRLLDALRCDSVSTLEARRNLDILHPAMRVRKMCLDGYDIRTVRIAADTGFGVKHSVACYVLFAEPERGDDDE